MKKNQFLFVLIAFIIILISVTSVSAQIKKNCGTMQYLEEQIKKDPGISKRMYELEKFTKKWIKENTGKSKKTIITIPVVVHVLYNYNSPVQNISEEQVLSQINILNEDFRMLNADSVNTPGVFKPFADDAQIEFCLAKRDPMGHATNGILRKGTAVDTFLHTTDWVKFDSLGGNDIWNPSQYLNIWVCNLGGGVLGYAQFPNGGNLSTDGVVINYKTFGTGGSTIAPFNLGRTATHEIGHWLNLRHIWGDAVCGNDSVTDTPTQDSANSGCPVFPKVTCGNGPNGDMFMDYMDYSDDNCMNIFTKDQVLRMKATIAGYRNSLEWSPGCIPPSGNWIIYDISNSGLPYNEILSIDVDENGNRWVGTSYGGLAIFKTTGNWKVFNIWNSSIADNMITAIDVKNPVKWVGTASGLSRYNGTDFDPKYSWFNSCLETGSINRILSGTNMWVGEYGGVAEGNFPACTMHDTSDMNISNGNSLALAVNPNGLWVGTLNGLLNYNGVSWVVYNTSNSAIPSDEIYDIALDSNNNLWLGTGYGLARFNGTNWVIYNPDNSGLCGSSVRDIEIDQNGIIWLAANCGVERFDDTSWILYSPDNSGLPTVFVNAISIDDYGNIWIGTQQGLAVFGEGSVTNVQQTGSFPETDVCSVFPVPFTNSATIRIKSDLFNSNDFLFFEIYDVLGKKMKELVLTQTITNLNRKKLPAGIYYYQLKKKETIIQSGKIIIQ